MEINGEPVRLVESWKDVRTGMLVYALCNWADCPASHHRGILANIKNIASVVFQDGSRMANIPGVVLLPEAHLPNLPLVITESTVYAKLLYEIIDEKFEEEQRIESLTNIKTNKKLLNASITSSTQR